MIIIIIMIIRKIVELQKTVIIYSTRILRKVLEILGVLLTPCFKPLSPLTKSVCDTMNNNYNNNNDNNNSSNNSIIIIQV